MIIAHLISIRRGIHVHMKRVSETLIFLSAYAVTSQKEIRAQKGDFKYLKGLFSKTASIPAFWEPYFFCYRLKIPPISWSRLHLQLSLVDDELKFFLTKAFGGRRKRGKAGGEGRCQQGIWGSGRRIPQLKTISHKISNDYTQGTHVHVNIWSGVTATI